MHVWLRQALFAPLDWFAPDTCAACQGPLATTRALLCTQCALSSPWEVLQRSVGGVPAWAFTRYAGAVQQAIQRFKFGGHPELARRFAYVAQQTLAPTLLACTGPQPALLVPVPLHPIRLAERGYNQAALFAQRLSTHTGHSPAPRALRRVSHTQQQSQLGRKARLDNLVGQFEARRDLTKQRVLLVDDVVTTGATALCCMQALRAAGAEVLGLISIAHTD